MIYIYTYDMYEWQKTDSCWWSQCVNNRWNPFAPNDWLQPPGKLVETQPQALPVPSQASPVAFPLHFTKMAVHGWWWSHSYHTHSKNPLMLPMVATPKRESDTDRNGSTHQRTHRYPHLARLEPSCLVVQVHAKEFDQLPVYPTVKWRNHRYDIYIYMIYLYLY